MSTADSINKDQTIPEDRWIFDEAVTDVFDDMLQRSIPQYEIMRKSVFNLGRYFVRGKDHILDLGCSRGEALAPFAETHTNPCIGIEISEPMRKAAQERFKDQAHVGIIDLDLRTHFPAVTSTLTLSILTLQFIPIEYRQNVVSRIYETLRPGGAFILVEKLLGETAQINRLLVENYYGLKGENGYSQE
jgi:tRNA (cmo5U34)-methyltransferase